MRYFVKHFWPEWDSKRDILAMAVAGKTGGEYWTPYSNGGAVVQAADGECEVPSGCLPSVCIYHDALEYDIVPRPLFRIGLGEDIPGCNVNLRSYPLRECDRYRLPASAKFDAVVGGQCGYFESCEEAIERAGLRGRRVAVAIPGNPAVAEEVSNRLREDGNEVTVVEGPQLPVISVLYRSCPAVVHLGHCRRGYLHSLAMYHASVPGRTLVERVPGLEKFEPAGIGELIQFLDG